MTLWRDDVLNYEKIAKWRKVHTFNIYLEFLNRTFVEGNENDRMKYVHLDKQKYLRPFLSRPAIFHRFIRLQNKIMLKCLK